jgi:uncharacterized protein (TIGR01244 family)
MPMPRKWIPLLAFLLAFLVGMGWVIGYVVWDKRQSQPAIAYKELVRGVWVTSQVSPDDIRAGKLRGVRKLVDLRPDGEAADQPASTQVAEAANAAGITFDYIPVPHGAIPDEAVTRLQATLEGRGPILLYCRSGSRAARTWALGEASQDQGRSASTIREIVTRAGFSTQDIDAQIDARIAARKQRAD